MYRDVILANCLVVKPLHGENGSANQHELVLVVHAEVIQYTTILILDDESTCGSELHGKISETRDEYIL